MAYYDLMDVNENLRQAKALIEPWEFDGPADEPAESLVRAVDLTIRAVEELVEAFKEAQRGDD